MSAPHAAMVAGEAASQMDIILAVSIFLITYAFILLEKINRAIIALLGAGLMILLGILTQHEAGFAVDFNTLGLLLGMMVIVAITKESGVFQYVAIKTSQMVKAAPMGILIMLSVVTAVFSALLDNVTTVLLITPVILLITKEMKINPYPYLFAAIISSNIGGTATLIGDPPNIMIGSAAGLGFMDFVRNLTPLSLIVFVLSLTPICLIWRKDLVADASARAKIMKMDAEAAITDKELLIKAIGVLLFVIGGFSIGHGYGIEPATFAIFGAALLLLLDNIHHNSEDQHERVHAAIAEAEWVTLFFFLGLFIVVGGIEKVGVIEWLAESLMHATGGDFQITGMAILWGGAVLSALVDNIPFVATMIPIIENMSGQFDEEQIGIFWWMLAAGACLGGNGSLIGASANLVVAGFAEKAGHGISFLKFMAMGFPLMLWSIMIATVYFYVLYL